MNPKNPAFRYAKGRPDFLISKLPWCHARRFFKLAGEVRNILEAAGDGNVADAHFALCEKLLGARNPAVDDVVDELSLIHISEPTRRS